MKNDLLVDLSNLVQLPIEVMNNINKIAEKDIAHIFYENYVLYGKEEITIDIGIGNLILYINKEKEYITYEFIPFKSLENMLLKTIEDKQSPLVVSIENTLSNKVMSLYKELV